MTTNRIHIDKDVYFNILKNKVVFGGAFLPSGYHLTFHFGPKSKHFDLHLTKNNIQFPIFIISHTNSEYLFEGLQNNFLNKVLVHFFHFIPNIHDYKDYQITIFDDDFYNSDERSAQIISDLKSAPNSKRLKIKTDSKLLSETIKKNSREDDYKNISFQELLKMESGIALLSNNRETKIFFKFKEFPNQFSEFTIKGKNKWYLFKSIFGFQLWYFILHSIKRGIKILNLKDAKEIVDKMEKPILEPIGYSGSICASHFGLIVPV
ncbi:MAG: hypothetical protein LAT51_10405, partial [Flavobacteriaceae bacterium]|nr:hypothetical protein [Flavobacteriaceae bacterium]